MVDEAKGDLLETNRAEQPDHAKIRMDRAPKLGDVEFGHGQLGRRWAACISEYIQIAVPDLPVTLVTLMLAELKIGRACKPGSFNPDHYADMRNYIDFAEECDQLNPAYKQSKVAARTVENLLMRSTNGPLSCGVQKT